MEKKKSIPSKQKGLLQRPRIERLLEKAIETPLITVIAGTGFGKTHEVSSFLWEQEGAVIWLPLTEIDNYYSHFWMNFIRVTAVYDEHLAEELSRMDFPTTLSEYHLFLKKFSEAAYKEKRMYLVFDDYHHIKEGPIREFVKNLMSANLENLVIFILTRNPQDINYASLYYKITAAYIRQEHLAFSLEETGRYLKQCCLDMDEDTILRIHSQTEGWPFAVNLLATRMRNANLEDKELMDYARTLVFEILEEEVFAKYDKEVQGALIKLAVLDAIPNQIMEELVGAYSADQIRKIIHSNTFIAYNPHTENFRIHYIFRELLHRKKETVDAEEIAHTHKVAARWYKSKGMWLDAVNSYRSIGDYDAVCSILLRLFPQYYTDRRTLDFVEVIHTLPEEYRERRPMLKILNACCHLFHLEIEEVNMRMLQCMESLKAMPVSRERDEAIGVGYINLAYYSMMMGTMQFKEYFKKASQYIPEGSSYYNEKIQVVRNDSIFSITGEREGELEQYVKDSLEMIPYTEKVLNGSGYGREYIVASEAGYMTGNISMAKEYAFEGIYKAKQREQTDIVCYGYFILMKTAVMSGNYDELMHNYEMMKSYSDTHYQLDRFGVPDFAMGWVYMKIDYADYVASWITREDIFENIGSTFELSRELLIRAGCYIIENKYREAIELLTKLTDIFAHKRQYFPLIYSYVVRSIAHDRVGDEERCLQDMETAYRMSYKNNIIMPFIENGRYMIDLLKKIRKNKTHTIPKSWLDDIIARTATYAKRTVYLRERFDHVYHIENREKIELTSREETILTSLCQGFTREEIAEDLGISVNTLKYTLKNIYAKLGAINSTDAVRIAIMKGAVNF